MERVDPRLGVHDYPEDGTAFPRQPSIVIRSGWSIDFGPSPSRMLAATAVVCAAIAAAYFLRSWEPLRIVGLTTLTGVAYSMVHNRLGNRAGYNTGFWQQPSFVFQVYAFAGTVFAVLSRATIPGLVLKITAVQLAPCFAIGVVLTLLVSHFAGNRAQYHVPPEALRSIPSKMPLRYQINWCMSWVRDATAGKAMAIGSVILAVGIVAARAGLIPIPL